MSFFLLLFSLSIISAISTDQLCVPKISFATPKRFFFYSDQLEQRVEVSWDPECNWIIDFSVAYPSKEFIYQNSFRTVSQWFQAEEKTRIKTVFVLQTRSISKEAQQIPLIEVSYFDKDNSTKKNYQISQEEWMICPPPQPILFWLHWIFLCLSGVLSSIVFFYKYRKKRKICIFLKKTFAPLSNLLELGLSLEHPAPSLMGQELWKDALSGLQKNFPQTTVSKDAAFFESVWDELSPELLQRVLFFVSQKQFASIVNLLSAFRKKFSGKDNELLSKN